MNTSTVQLKPINPDRYALSEYFLQCLLINYPDKEGILRSPWIRIDKSQGTFGIQSTNPGDKMILEVKPNEHFKI